jgi:hypothetical protein
MNKKMIQAAFKLANDILKETARCKSCKKKGGVFPCGRMFRPYHFKPDCKEVSNESD